MVSVLLTEEVDHMYFIVTQLNKKYSRQIEDYQPSKIRMIVARVKNEGEEDLLQYPYEFIGGKASKN